MTETIDMPGLRLPGLDDLRTRVKGLTDVLKSGRYFPRMRQEEDPSVERLRRDLVRVNNQFIQTQKIIKGDREALEKLAQSDQRVAKLLKLADSTVVQQVSNKILDRASVTQEESSAMIDSLKEATVILGQLDRTFAVNVGDVVADLGALVGDARIATSSRQKIVKDIASFTEQTTRAETRRQKQMKEVPPEQKKLLEEQIVLLKDLKRLALDDVSTSDFEANQDAIMQVVSKLSDRSLETKTYTTLNNLNKTLGSAVLTQQELKETLDQQAGQGKSLESMFREFPDLLSKGQQIKGGIASQLLGSVGLGPLDEMLGISSMIGQRGLLGTGRAVGGAAMGGLRTAGRLGGAGMKLGGKGLRGGLAAGRMGARGLGAAGRLAGGGLRLAGTLGKFLGPVGLALAVGQGAFDFASGYGRAGEIAGLGPGQEATFGQKVQAGTASALSGLSFGLIDEKTVYQGIDKIKGLVGDGINYLKEGVGKVWEQITTQPVGDTIQKAVSYLYSGLTLGLLSPETISAGIDRVKEAVFGGISFLWETITGIFDSVTGWITDKFASIRDTVSNLIPDWAKLLIPGVGTAMAGAAAGTPSSTQAPPETTATVRPAAGGTLPTVPTGQMMGTDVGGMLSKLTAILDRVGGQGRASTFNVDPVPNRATLSRSPDIGDPYLSMVGTLMDQ